MTDLGGNSGSREPSRVAPSRPIGFDPGRWYPIDSAPKDGTEFDAWVRCFEIGAAGSVVARDIGRYTNVYWGKQVETYTGPYERRESEVEGWVHKDDLHYLFVQVGGYRITHWMPLPDAP